MKLSDSAKKMIVSISATALICILGSAIYYRSFGFLPFMYGVFLGSFASIVKVFLLDRAVDKALTMEKKRAQNYIGIQHMLRLLLSGAVLILGALVPQISLWGTAAGILAFQLAAYSLKFTLKG